MNKKRHSLRDYVLLSIIVYLILVVISHQLEVFSPLNSVMENWATMKVVTALSFLLIAVSMLLENTRILLFHMWILATIHILVIMDTILFGTDGLSLLFDKSSGATSFLFILIAVSDILFQYRLYTRHRLVLKAIVYLTSGAATLLYIIDRAILYAIPLFESVSWNTAILFMLISIMLINRNILSLNSSEMTFKMLVTKRISEHLLIIPFSILLVFSILSWLDIVDLKVSLILTFSAFSAAMIFVGWSYRQELDKWKNDEKNNLQQLEIQNQELTTKNEELERHRNLLYDFAQIISHNLRGPAVSIANLSELIFEEKSRNPTQNEFKRLLKRQSFKHVQTIDELAEFHNMINERNLVYEACDLEKIASAEFDAQHSMFGGEAELVLKLERRTLVYPKLYLKNVMFNLISNAFKYRSSERKLLLSISSVTTRKGVLIQVCDNGLGMNMTRFRNKIFKYGKVYHNNPDSRGYGLFMIFNQLRRLGDVITVESEENKGSTFQIEINQPKNLIQQ